MHILIDIDDDLYTRLFDNGENNITDMHKACTAIRKGTPLPEHERLIILSEDATVAIIETDKQDYKNDDYYKGAQEEY